MNVFVLCTGRCGSTTFIKACQYITNYTASHEKNSQFIGKERLSYPSWHIEADNRLSWFLGSLDRRFGDDAFYVHLFRDREAVAESFFRRWGGGIIQAYQVGILMQRPIKKMDWNNKNYIMDICRDYYDTVNDNINAFLSNKTGKMKFELENWEECFPYFWEKISAEGDFDSSLGEWYKKYNAS
ncbi:hypothetical protein [Fodinicurvata fenggangensis]|uniref:hypothetical protein n=1 Tax=Fodinicurvata fenggangensis TaxID=1121830 RepID=UPI00047DA102|nr:hypothetical protein [Fodinicurvata fenggangensis]